MNRDVKRFQPDGRSTVTPRLFTSDVGGLVGFLRVVFGAHGELSPGLPAEMEIGNSIVMVSDGGGVRDATSSCLYVYVEDTDATYQRAIDAGARPIEPPGDMPYGDRRAIVQDAWGTTWQIATYRGAA
jgi:PhnB protein